MGWLENLKKQCLEIKKQIDLTTEELKNAKDNFPANKLTDLEKTLSGYFCHITVTLYEIQGWQNFFDHNYNDAIICFREALKNIVGISQQQMKLQKELSVQIGLVKSLSITNGYTSREVHEAYGHIQKISDSNNRIVAKFFSLRGFWFYYIMSSNFEMSANLSKDILTLANKVEHPILLLEAHIVLAISLFYIGSWEQLQINLDKAITICKQNRNKLQEHIFIENPILMIKALSALSLTYKGFPDKALEKMLLVCDFIEQVGTPYNIAFAYILMARLHQIRREVKETIHYAAKATKCAREYNIYLWEHVGQIILGWALIQNKNQEEALALMENSLLLLDAENVFLYKPLFLCLLAESYHKMGLFDEAVSTISEASSSLKNSLQPVYKAEILYVRGNIFLDHAHYAEDAIASFYEARKIANSYDMKFLELHALFRLAKHTQGEESIYLKGQLQNLYSWFNEGFKTTSLKEVKLLLS